MSKFKKFENYFLKKKNHFFKDYIFLMYYGVKNKKWKNRVFYSL